MTMPIDLILVRHGVSEGNAANARSRDGDDSDFQGEFMNRHSSKWRLIDDGREQARVAGKWIIEFLGTNFFRYYVSEYLRAMETAGYMNLPNAEWYIDFYLRERDWGALDLMTDQDRKLHFAKDLARKKIDSFYWSPPRGESMAQLCRRLDRIIGTLHRECANERVIVVCHGEVMWALRVRLERMLQSRFQELDESRDPFDHIHNCQILHYSRKDPVTGEISKYMDWMRSICPWDMNLSRNEWEKIERRTFGNDDLLAEADKHPRIITE